MTDKSEKISIRQALIMLIILVGSPTVRVLPTYAVKQAEQAAWLAPVFSSIIMIVYLYMLKQIYYKYENLSLIGIMENIFGKIIAKCLGILYFIYISLLAAFNLRFYSARLVTALSSHTSSLVFTMIMLAFLSYVLKLGIPVLARSNEVLLWFAVIPFLLVAIFILPNVKLSNLYPITHHDILPIIKGSHVVTAVWSYLTIILIFSDKINDKNGIFKSGALSIFLLCIFTIIVIIVSLGTFGTGTKVLGYPFVSATQSISIFDTIERVEALIVVVWIICDFTLMSTFLFSGLYTLKCTFKLSNCSALIDIYIVVIFFLSVYLVTDIFELQDLSSKFFIPFNIVFGFGIPFIMFFTGKLRRKI